MTLLVVLGIVVVVTILAALFLSLKSGRNRDGASAAGAAGDRQARGGSRSGRPSSLGGRVRSMTGRNKTDEYSGRRVAGRSDSGSGSGDDYGPPARPPRGTGGPERSGLVATGAGRGQDRGRPGPGYHDAGPAPRDGGYGRDAGGYGGYDAGADTRVSGPMSPEAGTEVFGAGRYDSPEPPRARHGHARGGAPSGFREPARDDFPPPDQGSGRADRGERGRMPAPAGYDVDTDPGATMAGFGGPERDDEGRDGGTGRDDRADGGRGGRRRGRGPAAPGNFDDATAALETGEGDPRAGGRRLGRIQKPRLRRDKSDFDENPWPGYDEEDGAIPDDKYWQDMYSDRPLSTTARTAHPATDAGPGWGGPPAEPGPVPAGQDSSPQDRGRRGRRRQEDPLTTAGPAGPLDPGTEPRPLIPPDPGPGPGRRGRAQPPRPAEEDPLTSESFSRHAQEAADSRSYRPSWDPNRPPARGPRDSAAADTQAIQRDPRGYGPDPLSGPNPLSAPGSRGGRGGPGGTPDGGLPGGGPPAAPRRDPYSDNGYRGPGPDHGYRNGTGPGAGYPDRAGGYPPPGRGGPRTPAPAPGAGPAGPGYPPGYSAGNGYPAGGYPAANGRPPVPPAPGGPPPSNGTGRRTRPALPAPGQGAGPAPGTGGRSPGPSGPGGPDRRPGYGPNGGSPYPGQPSGGPGYPADPSYPGDGYPPNPGGPPGGGPGGPPRGRRAAGRDGQDGRGGSRRRPDDDYDEPYPPDDRRY